MKKESLSAADAGSIDPAGISQKQPGSEISPDNIPIRGRTFNPELEKIIKRIKDNEDTDEEMPPDFSRENPDRSGILYLLQRLYYRTNGLLEANEINRVFNLEEAVYANAETGSLFELYCSGFSELFYDGALLLKYDPESRGYRGAFSKGIPGAARDLYIGLRDRIHFSILKEESGLTLSPEDQVSGEFVTKSFIPEKFREYSLYLVPLGRIYAGLRVEAGIAEPCPPLIELSSLLVIFFRNRNINSPDELLSILKTNMIAAALLDSGGDEHPCGTGVSLRDVEPYLLFTLFRENGSAHSVSADSPDPESFFIIKYLIFRLRARLGKSVAFIIPGFAKVLVFSTENIGDTINEILDGLRHGFRVEAVPREDMDDLNYFYCRYIV